MLIYLFSLATVDSGLGSEFNITTWPVAERCKGHLEDLVSTHDICPLPAYDENHVLIPPLQYESKLKGALVEVHMAFCHHRINKSKRDIFNCILRELIVLSPPAAMPTSPFKRRRLNAGPSTERPNKGKQPIRGSGSSPWTIVVCVQSIHWHHHCSYTNYLPQLNIVQASTQRILKRVTSVVVLHIFLPICSKFITQ
jgi:hypothetical protein